MKSVIKITKLGLSIIKLMLMWIVIIEISLQITGLTYTKIIKPKKKLQVLGTFNTVKKLHEKNSTFIFIGDSWTTDADVPKGNGYTHVLHNLLTTNFSQNNFSFYNLARSSNNSSEAIISFLRSYKQYKPQYLFILTGINNRWNTFDVNTANKELASALNIRDFTTKNSSFLQNINYLYKLKLFRLYSLLKLELVDRKIPLEYGHPMDNLGVKYFELFGKNKKDEALEYLTTNYQLADSYSNFYRYILYHFSYNQPKADEYLSNKNIYFPDRITIKFNQQEHNELIQNLPTIFETQIKLTNELCLQNNITLILQTYPEVGNNTHFSEVNSMIRYTANKYSIHLIDHEYSFKDKYDFETWKNKIKTPHHVSIDGYKTMADDLFDYLVENNLI